MISRNTSRRSKNKPQRPLGGLSPSGGRGFAVVANNIRNLAEETNQSVSKVTTTITSLKNALSDSIDDIYLSINQIASVAEETASGAEEASAATEEQAATMQELTANAQELANMANNLETIISKFKINSKNKLADSTTTGIHQSISKSSKLSKLNIIKKISKSGN